MTVHILGLSAYYHDSAACLVRDGEIVAAAQQERFSRKKHDARFPADAIRTCLDLGGIGLAELDHVVFYDKPLVKFERLLETYLAYAPRGLTQFLQAMPVWLSEKLMLKDLLRRELAALPGAPPLEALPVLKFTSHHQSHAASAFFPSPYSHAAVLCMDGVGEWATTSVWLGEDNRLTPQWEIQFPHSLGLLYSAFTYYTGFKVNAGEYKLMGLAPYGEPKYQDLIMEHLLALKDDGSFRMNMRYFSYATGLTMTSRAFHKLFGGPPRQPESPITQREMDLAASVQAVTEEVVLRLGRTVHRELGAEHLCLAGGVALNCVANGRLKREGPFRDIWVQPAAGDAGGALGAALSVWHEYLDQPRNSAPLTSAPGPVDAAPSGPSWAAGGGQDRMRGAFLGPSHDNAEIETYLRDQGAPYRRLNDDALMPALAELLDAGQVIGWFQGPMEFGPRALGGRSIIGDPRNADMQSTMNLKIKYRESFRPFAPAVLAEQVSDWFEHDGPSPYMLMVAPVAVAHRLAHGDAEPQRFGIDKLKVPRSQVPAITHVDYSARLQTVHRETNPRFHRLIRSFATRTGCPMVVNTSFNVRGEPIVARPADAYRCFMRTEMDALVLENCLLLKSEQPAIARDERWQDEFELD